MDDSTHPQPAPAIPVICERCRAEGMAGDEAFAAIPDLLGFDPVPRRTHPNGWTPEHQRAFIAALAITGSPRQAARHVGRAAFGAEQLRTARGGKGFAAAWDAALDLARDRELARLHENLGDLKARTDAEWEKARAEGRPVAGADEDCDGEEGGQSHDERMKEIRERLVEKLERLRLETLRAVMDDPEKRMAYDIVYGPHDWDSVEDGTWPASTEPKAPDSAADEASTLSSPSENAEARDEHRSHAGGVASTASEHSRPNKGPRVRRV